MTHLGVIQQLVLQQAQQAAPQATTTLGKPTVASIGFFFLIVAVTLVITYFAAKKTKTSSEFYAAGRSVSALQNGFALAGDYMSAASFLGISGMVALKGYDGMIYATGWLVGWPALMFLVAEPLRNLGKFTFADVVAFRLRQKPVRIAAAIGGILTVLFYTIAQMVGSGALIQLMFGLKYEIAEIIVGVVMLAYVLFGGMLATTWVQIIKAGLLLFGVTILTGLVLARFGFNPGNLYKAVVDQYGQPSLEPGGFVANPVEAVSLGLALMFGLLGLPHILMRFYTVPDAKAARKSVLYATGLIGYFYLIIPIVGFGAAVLTPGGRAFITSIDKGGNMASPILAEQLLGSGFLGFIAAVAFATILAVVAGLTLAGASAYSHDIYVNVIKGGHATEEEQVKAAKTATVVFGIFAVGLGILFKGQNVAFMVGLAFAIAASANFPALLMSIVWKRFTTMGAVWSILVGAFSSCIMILLSPTVWGEVFHHLDAAGKPYGILPWKNPAIFSMTAAFVAGIVVSLVTADQGAQDKFEDEKLRTYLGVGAE
ncbi:solute symporter family protein [Anaeromyxobacter dehalogenans]|uniref:SSS sodium solute transporter superfamily n=1 Tax=Anaeromyxobacter dehalogenans (strain 2CP-C) TaxID=290397 RepID=Q2IFW4_ANADE|nr:sodium/solute symporter [Anaeromyxobacter dehalogenans]ABC83469.1 SSS sodium solute transporter superfamily [Anaeromyxobacter dehalogenans 2CP-C]